MTVGDHASGSSRPPGPGPSRSWFTPVSSWVFCLLDSATRGWFPTTRVTAPPAPGRVMTKGVTHDEYRLRRLDRAGHPAVASQTGQPHARGRGARRGAEADHRDVSADDVRGGRHRRHGHLL